MERAIHSLRRAVLAVVQNEALFLFVAFIGVAALGNDFFAARYSEEVELFYSYVVNPWGMVMVALRLNRRAQNPERKRMHADIGVLALLALWIVVPFAIRFGFVFNNVTSWYNYLVAYFGIYAMTSEEAPASRQKLLRLAGMLFTGFSLLAGGLLVYCALTGQVFGADLSGCPIGVENGFLYGGVHYNTTGMIALCCTLMCLTAFCCEEKKMVKLLSLAAAMLMAGVVVLTQSRTARYSLLIALAAGAYGGVVAHGRMMKRRLLRHGTALLCAIVVLCAGYTLANRMTDAMLEHYMGWEENTGAAEGHATGVIPAASAQEALAETARTEAASALPADEEATQAQLHARAPVDATFSDRTNLWRNLFAYWGGNPRYLFLGNGVGRTGRMIVEGTVHEESGSAPVHNTYLQYIADFGLIGFALQVLFLLLVFAKARHVFFAEGKGGCRGGRGMCMVVVASLATGMMESAPWGAMSVMNMVMCFALAQLMAMGRELSEKREGSMDFLS